MIDSFLFFTPFLVLGIIALLGFVGCDVVFGLHHVDYIGPPTGFNAVPGDGRVDLSWDAFSGATQYSLKRGTLSGMYSITFSIGAPATTYADLAVSNGTDYFYVLTASVPAGTSDVTGEVEATPAPPPPTFTPFVTSVALGTFQNQLSGWAGMVIQIGPNPITVKMLGRLFGPGNTGTHDVKIFDPSAMADVATVSIDVTIGTVGKFTYAMLPTPVTLNAGFVYYVVSFETIGADHFYIQDTTVQTTNVAAVTSAVTGSGQNIFTPTGGPGHTWGPVDFQY